VVGFDIVCHEAIITF